MAQKETIIIGVDPGTSIMGYGIIKVVGKQTELLTLGVIKLDKISDHALKLEKIFNRIASLIDEFNPDEMALEAPFFGKNVQSMLKLGRAQGVAIAAALSRQVPFTEYAPKKIKQSITGNGNASKEQVAFMLNKMYKIPEKQVYLDATDALGAAVCHFYQLDNPIPTGAGSWKKFISNNPGRVK